MEITFIPQECILLCRRGMHSLERGGLEFPKQLNCSSKHFFEEKVWGEGTLIPLLRSSQCCHMRKFKKCWLYIWSVIQRQTFAISIGMNNRHRGQQRAAWANSFISSPRQPVLFPPCVRPDCNWKREKKKGSHSMHHTDSGKKNTKIYSSGNCFSSLRVSCCDNFLWQVDPQDTCTTHTHPSIIYYISVSTAWGARGVLFLYLLSTSQLTSIIESSLKCKTGLLTQVPWAENTRKQRCDHLCIVNLFKYGQVSAPSCSPRTRGLPRVCRAMLSQWWSGQMCSC